MTRLIRALPFARAGPRSRRCRPRRADGPVAEIVTFRLAPGTTETRLPRRRPRHRHAPRRRAGLRLPTPVEGRGRRLDRPHRLDEPRAQAEAAAARIMSDPAAAPFLAAIDPASIAMRHEALLWTMETR
jgi:hypothetical protein